MSWYNTQGPCQSFVLFTKVKYIRNIAKQHFYPLSDQKRGSECFAKLESILTKNGFRGERTVSGVTPALVSLAEKQFIERDFLYTEKTRALYLNEPCNLLVSLGGDNLITISSAVAGLSVIEAKNMASGAEELIDREINFAYSENIGYLSPAPSECGSGISFLAALYLPSAAVKRASDSLRCELFRKGMLLSPMFSKNNSGDLYILSYTPHYLCDEDSAAVFFTDTVKALCEQEKKALTALCLPEKELLNEAKRALALLTCSDSVTEDEMLFAISKIRLCLCLFQDHADKLVSLTALNYLSAEGLNCSVIASAKNKCETQEECDEARAVMLSGYIQVKKEVSDVK